MFLGHFGIGFGAKKGTIRIAKRTHFIAAKLKWKFVLLACWANRNRNATERLPYYKS